MFFWWVRSNFFSHSSSWVGCKRGGGSRGGRGGSLIPPLSTVGWLTLGCSTVEWFRKPEKSWKTQKIIKTKKKKKKKMCYRRSILAIRPLTRSLRDLGKWVFAMARKYIQTDGHGDSMTESDHWADSVKITKIQSIQSISCGFRQSPPGNPFPGGQETSGRRAFLWNCFGSL